MDKQFIKVRSFKDITIFSSLILSGITLIVLPTGTSINLTGFFLIFIGILLAFVLKTAYQDPETGEKFSKQEHFFQQTMQPSILLAIENNPETISLPPKGQDTALKLEIYYSRASKKAYLQLFEYVPFQYQPCSKCYEHSIASVDKLIK